MSDKISLTAQLRQDVGKGASRRLRRNGEQVPAIVYGAGDAPQNLTLAVNELSKAMQVEAFYSQILDVVVEGSAQQAVVRDLQRDPASGRVLHIDFLRISPDQELRVSVPMHFINEDKCVGVRIGGGNIAHNLNEVEISALPADLPEYIEVDMEEIDAGTSIHLSDLVLPDGVTIVALTYGEDRDIPVVSVTTRRGGSQADDEDDVAAEAAPAEEAGEDDADAEEG
ncbi:MAG: 50S ribosomal protein L25/general stress protein Ctc [Pseudomonadota bacterium]